MRKSIDEIKAELGLGRVVCRPRQTGKTTALLEFVHEYCSGFCYFVTCNYNMADILTRQYKKRYPDDEQPIFLTLDHLRGRGVIEGRPRCWVTDEVWPEAVERKQDSIVTLTYLGGVGTPMCMDMHSNR